MYEHLPDSELNKQKLNRIVVIDALQEIGIDVQLSDWLEYDDDQIIADLARYSVILGVGVEDLFEVCRIDIESIGDNDEV